MSTNTSRIIEVEVTSDEGDMSVDESEEIANDEEERHAWIWSEQIRLVELVSIHTKNWANILDILHKEHLCTDISNYKKLRTKFTSINASTSAFRKAFKKTKFSPPSKNPQNGRKLTKEEIKTLEKNHNAAEEKRRQDHATTQARLDKIQADEIKASKGRGKKRRIEQVQSTLTAEEVERREKTKARIESARREAAKDRERQELMIQVLQQSILVLKQTNGLIERLQSDIYPTQPFNPQNNNSVDEE